ncbi:hypothetical protein ZHAS_00007280 [Anopheles sinensis]|uniref:Uncharacterized protein n=1 Tax=Anopheles sinensis TaxID=74873 RepID=A0A084VPK8_ANOSI|nr:hypothetical protein ZHAS_00007280 [Anopheles sinensis]
MAFSSSCMCLQMIYDEVLRGALGLTPSETSGVRTGAEDQTRHYLQDQGCTRKRSVRNFALSGICTTSLRSRSTTNDEAEQRFVCAFRLVFG